MRFPQDDKTFLGTGILFQLKLLSGSSLDFEGARINIFHAVGCINSIPM